MRQPYPALLPALSLKNLRKLRVTVLIRYDGKRLVEDPASQWFEATGKGAGRVKCDSPQAETKCRAYAERHAALKAAARALIDRQRL